MQWIPKARKHFYMGMGCN